MNKKINNIILLIVIYLLSGSATYTSIAYFSKDSTLISPADNSMQPITATALQIDPSEPKDQICPINGKLFTKTEMESWSTKRPALVMIENHPEARPQSGLSSADIVYEAIAEGGITRFMGVFYCQAQANLGNVAPVRSARIYFVNIAAGYNTPIYTHVGGGNCSRDEGTGQCTSNKKTWALEELTTLGWRVAGGNDFDTTFDSGAPVFIRDYNRLGQDKALATEHTMVGSLSAIWNQAAKRGFTNKMESGDEWVDEFRPWEFSENKTTKAEDKAETISFEFWKGYADFTVRWEYDPQTKLYKRLMAGSPHKDLENGNQISARTIITQFVVETGPLDIHKHMYYDIIGKGDATIHYDGKSFAATWKKINQEGRTIFYDEAGKEVVFPGGQIWIELLPKGNKVIYE